MILSQSKIVAFFKGYLAKSSAFFENRVCQEVLENSWIYLKKYFRNKNPLNFVKHFLGLFTEIIGFFGNISGFSQSKIIVFLRLSSENILGFKKYMLGPRQKARILKVFYGPKKSCFLPPWQIPSNFQKSLREPPVEHLAFLRNFLRTSLLKTEK